MPKQKESNASIPPSAEFLSAFTCCGTSVATCGFCGRVRFAVRDLDDEDYADLIDKANHEPDRYIQDPENDSIAVGELAGSILVWGCPCNAARRYEDFIWRHRLAIIDYLKRRSQKDLAQAAAEAAQIAEVL